MSVTQPTHDWEFRQISTTSITDSIGGLTATYTNGVTSSLANGAYFAGGDNSSGPYIDLSDFQFGGTAFSIEAYVQFDSTASSARIIDFGSDQGGTTGYNLILRRMGGTNEFSWASSTALGGTIVNGQLTHIVATISSTGVYKLYQDGSLVITESGSVPTLATRTGHYIGKSWWEDDMFEGYMQYIRIWKSTELSSSEVSTLYANRATVNYSDWKPLTLPTHDWDFRQTVSAGGTVKDNINGTFATYNNGLTSDPTKGLDLSDDNGEGANDKFASLAPFNTGTEFSMEFYFQKTAHASANEWPYLIQITNNTSDYSSSDSFFASSWSATIEPHYLYTAIKGSNGTLNTILIDDANVYAHVVVTFNDTTKEINTYLNGSLVLTDTKNVSFTDTTYTYNYLGATPVQMGTIKRQFNCYLYYFRYWKDGVLSSSDVSTLYTNRATTNYFGTQPLPIPTHDWDFRQTVSAGGTIGDNINGTTATLTGVSADATNGAALTNSNHTDYIALNPFNTGTEFSMEFYFQKLTFTSTNWPNLIHISDSQTGFSPHFCYFQHDTTNNDLQTSFNSHTSYGIDDSTNLVIADNDYVHFVVTWNDTSKELNHYLNGSLVDTVTLSSLSFTDANYTYNYLGNNTNLQSKGYNVNFYYFRYWKNGILSSSDVSTLYANRSAINYFSLANMRINYGDVYLAQTLNKTLADYQAENIPLHDISFGAFPSANKYKQSYAKTLLDLSGEFVHRKHTFIGDISFNNDLSINNVMVVNNDLSFNKGLIVNGDASFNGNVNAIGDITLNGNLKLKDKSIETSALNFTILANEGTFDSTKDVSLNSTFTVQGDFDKYIDTAGNIQTDFSENVVLIPNSLGLDLSGGSATLSGKTGDQAFLNGTYIVKDNSGNTTGNIYDDLHENTAATPGQLSVTPDYYWDFRVATPSGNTLADRVSGINTTYVGGITSSEANGVYFDERETIGHTAPQTQYLTTGNISSGTNLSVELYAQPFDTTQQVGGITWFFHLYSGTNMSSYSVSDHYLAIGLKLDASSYSLPYIQNFSTANSALLNTTGNMSDILYSEGPVHLVMNWNNTSKELNVYINGSLTHTSTHSTVTNWSAVTTTNNIFGCWPSPTATARPYSGSIYYLRYYTDKIVSASDAAVLYANASTINWDFQNVVNYNKLTSLPKNWNSLQVNSRGNWVYDGSSNYTSYLDEYGRPQTVKGDNYDLTLPFHFYPSKAFLRTTPLLPASSSINPHNYPASVKFLGATNTPNSSYDIDTTPTFNWDFRTNVDASGVVIDSISQNKATINDTFCTEGQGLICNNLGDKATFEPFLTSDVANTVEMFCYHSRNDSTDSAYWFNIVDTEDSKGAGYIAHRIRNTGNNDFYVNGSSVGSTYTYPNAPNFDAVNHIVMTITSTTAKCYVNGSLVGSNTHSRTLVAGTYAYNSIGNRGSDTDQLYGNIYYVRFWNGTEITANQVSALYNNRYNTYLYKNTGPSKYHLLGEFSNKATTVIADSSANYTYNSVVYLKDLPTAVYAWDFRVATSTSINDSIQNATATYYQTSSTIEDGLAFTGQDAHATIPTGILINSGPSEVSWEIYFKYTTVLGVWDMILHLYLNSSNQLRFTQYGDSGYFTFRYGNVSPTNIGSDSDSYREHKITNLSTSALVDTWIHLIATVEYPADYTTNGTTIRYYHNGSLINTVTGGGYNTGTSATTSSNNNSIGANNGSAATSFNAVGNIRYLRFFNKKLSEEEVTSLYNNRDQMLLLDGIYQNYIHGADFLYDLNRKYYINQLRMIVDQAPDSSGNSYGQYSIDRLAYSGSSFSGKKLENSYPNLYLNTAAHDISYGFTDDHTNIVYDLSHNKNQLPIIDMSGGGGIHIAPREISIQDGSLNTINIHKPTIKNTYSKPTAYDSIPTPFLYWELRRSSGDVAKVDTIQNKEFDTFDNITVSTSTGAVVDSTSDAIGGSNLWLTPDYTVEFYWTVASADIDSYPTMIHVRDPNGIQNGYGGLWLRRAGNDIWAINNGYTSTSTNTFSGNSDTAKDCALGTTNHVVLSVSTTNGTIKGYVNNVLVVDTTFTTPMENHLWENFSFGSAMTSGTGDASRYDCAGDYYYLRFYHTALNTEQITTLYNGRTIIDYNNWTYKLLSSDFYNYFGARDASGHFNKRISQDGKTIATLQHRGFEAYDASYAEVVFSTDYGKNWKNILRDCSDSFLFTEHDISYGLLFATGDVSGAIDIATSSNGQTMYVGRHRNWVSDESSYSGLGEKGVVYSAIPIESTYSTGFPQSIIGGSSFGHRVQSSTVSVSNNSTSSMFDGDYTLTCTSDMDYASGYSNQPREWFPVKAEPDAEYHSSSNTHGDFRPNSGTWSGSTYIGSNHLTVTNTDGTTYTSSGQYFTVTWPSTLLVKFNQLNMQLQLDMGGYLKAFGEETDGTIRFLTDLVGGQNQFGWVHTTLTETTLPLTKFYIQMTSYKEYLRIHNMHFYGTYQSTAGVAGIPITNGLPEIYSTNYGNSWKLSPFKYHKGPTIISGDGSTILLLQESKLDNTKHAYSAISGDGNNTALVDTHWITTDYGSNWNTLNRSGYDISNNVIPPSYGSKTATFLKACMSYTGQYIYIYNVQCTTNNNYGELYYSHDYGNTWNKWTTVEAQNYIASGNALAGSGQILCSGNGKYVFIAGQAAGTSRLSEAIYYRSSDYGVTFNKDITTFPWQEGSSGEDSTSRGPFISYEGDLIVISNTHYNYLDDSSANQLYSSTTYTGLKYSLDYGVNYNVLELNEEPLSTVTNNFSNLPNQTNEFFSSLFSTKGDIFSNCPGPNDYSFLTTVMGGNTTDASFVFLQSIEFPKDKISTVVEKEGPVITSYEESIDTENDFGNITNTTSLTSGVSFYSSAISEDGQVLLSAGATDVSNGGFYGGYNLTNAKFPPTENIVTEAIPTPAFYWDFRRSTVSEAQVDTIQQKSFYTWQGVNVSTTNGAVVAQQAPTDSLVINNITLDANFTIELFYKINPNTINSPTYNATFQLNSPSELHYNMGNIWYRSLQGALWIHTDWTSQNGGYPYNDSSYAHVDDTEYHLVLVFNSDTNTFTEYRNNSVFWTDTSLRTGQQHTYEIFTLGGATGRQTSSNGTTSGQEPTFLNRDSLNQEGDYYYLRFYNYALNAKQVDTLYQGRSTIDYNNWTAYANIGLANIPHFKTAQLSYNGNYAMIVPYGITQTNAQNLYYWNANGDFHRFDGNYLSNFDAENWKFGKLSGNGNFFVGFTHSSTTLSDASYNSATWWQDKVSNTMIIYKNLYTMPRGTVSDSDATTYGQGTTYDLNTAFSTDSGVTEYYITSVHVSETGQYVLFVGGSSDTTLTNRCAFSKDYGATFTNITSLFSFTDITKPLVYCHVSDNGRYLFISQYNSSEYCFSTDYGASFTLHNTFPSSTKTYGVVSKDGQNALFVDTNKHVYVSVNGNFRQEVIPSLSGTNTSLSLNHNYWKYKSTTGEITYNPSMPNIKYLVGTANNIIETSGSITAPTHSYEFRLAKSSSVSDQMGSGGTATYEGGSVSTTTDGVVLDNTDNTNGPKYVSITPPTISDSTHSIEIYFKLTTDIEAYALITSLKSASEGEKWISTTGSANNTFQNNNAQTGIDTVYNTTNPTAGETYHAVVSATKNGNVVFYINNAYTNTGTVTTFTYTPTAWELGRRANNASNYADITVYYVRWWDGHALSSSEVSYLYTNRADSTFISQIVLSSSNVRYTESYFSELDIKGSLTNLSGTAYTSSDYRVKENVRDLEDSDSIASLTPISYTQNNLHHKKSIGFLAHEFAESFPDLVDGTKDGPEMQSINYNGIIAVLIKEIQTLRAKINKLKSEI